MDKRFVQKLILEMERVDQETRMSAKPGRGPLNFLVYAIDGVHNYRLRQIIKGFGYPTQKTVGKETLHAFWLLVQHQNFDVTLQEACLKKCGFEGPDEAHLADRIQINKGLPQIFGTQSYRDKKGVLRLRPIKDKRKVSALRKKYGLPPLKGFVK